MLVARESEKQSHVNLTAVKRYAVQTGKMQSSIH